MRFKESNEDIDLLEGAQTATDFQGLMSQLVQQPAPLSRRISRITSSLTGRVISLDVMIQGSPALSSVIWGSLKVLLSTDSVSPTWQPILSKGSKI